MSGHLTSKEWGTPDQVTFALGFVQAAKRAGREMCPLNCDFLIEVLRRAAEPPLTAETFYAAMDAAKRDAEPPTDPLREAVSDFLIGSWPASGERCAYRGDAWFDEFARRIALLRKAFDSHAVTKTATPAIEFEVGEKVTGASGTVGTVTSNDFVNLLGERLYHVAYPTLGVAVSVPGKDLRRAHETKGGQS